MGRPGLEPGTNALKGRQSAARRLGFKNQFPGGSPNRTAILDNAFIRQQFVKQLMRRW
jgi:hypothetical protein